jgi:uncharacterized repeat protein (TIGR03803 family)
MLNHATNNHRRPNCCKRATIALLAATTAVAVHAQTLSTLVTFNGADGANPYFEPLVQGINGSLYGTTLYGGSGSGTVFNITTQGTLTTLLSFDSTDGSQPQAGLLLAANGTFYGTTSAGGANGDGSIFEITAGGQLTTLHSFSGADGSNPDCTLVLATDGELYGTTWAGGANGLGTVFEISTKGVFKSVHSFSGSDGKWPSGGLVQATNGTLYGTTFTGGTSNFGTVFAITAKGKLNTLYNFEGFADCGEPFAALIQGADGNLYGTTSGTLPECPSGGVFEISTAGSLTILHVFGGSTFDGDGSSPEGALVQATDGNFYGTTATGGNNNAGTIFRVVPGAGPGPVTLYSFTGATDGSNPESTLIQATDGNFYGTTRGVNIGNGGTVFSLSLGLAPFVETLPTFAKAGQQVDILGTDLTGATGVTFNGTEARFTVVSPTEIRTHVPTGATSGSVQVVTPNGTLSSNVSFDVK